MVDPSSLRAFAGRDWRALAESKEAYWLERKRAEGPAAGVRAAEALLAQVRRARPDWPSEAEREEDRRMHLFVAEVTARVGRLDR
ncbi:MAG: hypothetical protein IPM79_30425 [Polyangiaceae bacterium]|jgi:hypothetical protein|nr:hypothetical protein [Polyangiaceae bacterium]MBK8941802.1 hypothetical protein [Polyangiaceae bacterium]